MGMSQIEKKQNVFVGYEGKHRILSDFKKNKIIYLMLIPVVLYYIIFCYVPMGGIIIAFKNYIPSKGIFASQWAGLTYFSDFFRSYYFTRILRNTLWISINSIFWGFPAPIILALLINELRNRTFKSWVQTISYLPHFISLVVICGMIKDFTAHTGIINYFIGLFGFENVNMLEKPNLFMPVYIISDIWQGIGWGSIIYLAALAGIDSQLYEAATIDGAGRWKQTIHVTLPGIMSTIIIMLILRLGGILSVGFEKIILLYNPVTYETADVISTFVFRKGLQEYNWGYSTAVGLFNSVVNFAFIALSNWLSRKYSQISLW